MLKKKELLTRTVPLDGEEYTVQSMTVHQRTAFEGALVAHGAAYIREALLVFCVSLKGVPAFSADQFADQVDIDEKGLTAEQIAQKTEEQALFLLLDDLATYPAEQLEPLVVACQQVNGLLGNDSPQS